MPVIVFAHCCSIHGVLARVSLPGSSEEGKKREGRGEADTCMAQAGIKGACA